MIHWVHILSEYLQEPSRSIYSVKDGLAVWTSHDSIRETRSGLCVATAVVWWRFLHCTAYYRLESEGGDVKPQVLVV